MTELDFEQLYMFWALKGKITNTLKLGRKIHNKRKGQTKTFTITTKDYKVEVLFVVWENPVEYNILSADCQHNNTGLWVKYAGEFAVNKLNKL